MKHNPSPGKLYGMVENHLRQHLGFTSSKLQKGFGFLHKPFGNVSTILPIVFQWRTTTSVCRDRPMKVSFCWLSDIVDIVQIGLSLYAGLFPSHSLAQPNRPWISTQNCEKRLFGDIHIRTGMSVKSAHQ